MDIYWTVMKKKKKTLSVNENIKLLENRLNKGKC